MSIKNLDEFDGILKSGADSFNISPRKTSFGVVANGIKSYQKTKRYQNIFAFCAVVSVLYFSWHLANKNKPNPKSYTHSNFIKRHSIDLAPSIFTTSNFSSNTFLTKQPSYQLYSFVSFKQNNIDLSLYSNPTTPTEEINPIQIHVKDIALKPIKQSIKSPHVLKLKTAKPSSINWNIFASTGYSFRKLNYVSNNINNPNSFTNTDGFDWKQHQAIAGVLFGISGSKYVRNKFYLKSGVQVYIGGYDIKNKFTTYNTTSVMNKVDANQQEVRSAYRICYLETPFLIGSSKKFSSYKLNLDGGATLSTRIYESTPESAGLLGREYAVWNGKTKLINVTIQATPSITYQFLGTQFNTGIELRYQITSTYIKAYPAKEHLYFVGLKTGITL